MHVITRSINEYNQDGDYFFCCFNHKPTREKLRIVFFGKDYDPNTSPKKTRNKRENFITNLLKGGGRIEKEEEWYFLTQMQDAKIYKSKQF